MSKKVIALLVHTDVKLYLQGIWTLQEKSFEPVMYVKYAAKQHFSLL